VPQTILRPVSAVVETWDPADGTNASVLADQAPGSGVVALVPGLEEFYELENLPAEIDNVIAVEIVWDAVKSDAAAASFTPLWTKPGGPVVEGALIAPSVSVVAYARALAEPPGGGPWTPAGVNALRPGHRSTVVTTAFLSVRELYALVTWSPAGTKRLRRGPLLGVQRPRLLVRMGD
jgi:hypothetical protein